MECIRILFLFPYVTFISLFITILYSNILSDIRKSRNLLKQIAWIYVLIKIVIVIVSLSEYFKILLWNMEVGWFLTNQIDGATHWYDK